MPTYEYRCPSCGNEFDKFQRMSDPPVAECPRCGASAERRISGGAGLVFKGSGFYITDYARGGDYKKAAEADKGGSSTSSPAADKGSAASSGGTTSGGESKPAPSKPSGGASKSE
jgi:putative FmdB family regulatory protein